MTGIFTADAENRGLVLDPRTKLAVMITLVVFALGNTGSDIAAVRYATIALCALPMVLLFTAKKYKKDIYVIGADGTDEAYDSIKNGELSATISMFPYYEGMMASEVTTRIMLGQTMPKVIWTPSLAVDAENIETDDATLINWVDPTFE